MDFIKKSKLGNINIANILLIAPQFYQSEAITENKSLSKHDLLSN